MTRQDIDAIAVTYAPGLIGAVLVGVNFAKAAALQPRRAARSGPPYPRPHRGQLSGLSRIWSRRFCALSSPADIR